MGVSVGLPRHSQTAVDSCCPSRALVPTACSHYSSMKPWSSWLRPPCLSKGQAVTGIYILTSSGLVGGFGSPFQKSISMASFWDNPECNLYPRVPLWTQNKAFLLETMTSFFPRRASFLPSTPLSRLHPSLPSRAALRGNTTVFPFYCCGNQWPQLGWLKT